ncbi:hypothetical protein NW731_04820 [Mycoplasmopsis felis]|nr:hypothetical protein [Mycoplasmopsis felis]MCU9937735.1 hypothetical protein [Mycoplasmopsis felis]
MEKMDCSRSIVVSAYQKLESIGAIYSISKRGHFVAENFHNLIKPIPFMLDVDRIFTMKFHLLNLTDSKKRI